MKFALMSIGDVPTKFPCPSMLASTIGLEKFKNSTSNWSSIFLSKTENISSIFEYSSTFNNENGDCVLPELILFIYESGCG